MMYLNYNLYFFSSLFGLFAITHYMYIKKMHNSSTIGEFLKLLSGFCMDYCYSDGTSLNLSEERLKVALQYAPTNG